MTFVYQDLPNPNPSGVCMCGCGEPTQIATYTDSPKGRVTGKPLRYLPRHSNRAFPHSAEAGICQRYLAGEASSALAREFDCSTAAICNMLERHGVKRRSQQEVQTKYTCDHNFFDALNSEAKAYWAGFIATDGCVSDNGTLHIAVSARDKDHLQRFMLDIGATGIVSERSLLSQPPSRPQAAMTPVSSITIRSDRLCSALTQQGITPRKTYTLQWPEDTIASHLMPHYIRGLSDGDGWFTSVTSNYVPRHGKRATNYHWGFCGTESMCTGLRSYLMQAVNLRPAKIVTPVGCDTRIKRFSYGGNKQVARIARLLYSDAQVYLPRKRAIVEHLL